MSPRVTINKSCLVCGKFTKGGIVLCDKCYKKADKRIKRRKRHEDG